MFMVYGFIGGEWHQVYVGNNRQLAQKAYDRCPVARIYKNNEKIKEKL